MQESQIVTYFIGHRPFDSLDSKQGVQRLIFLEVDPCQAKDGFVADLLLDIAFDHRGNGAPGAKVHPVGKFKISYGKLGMVDMVVKRIQFGFVESVE